MNAKHLVAAFAVFAATGSVLAQEFVAPDANFVSTRTRAEVVAEIAQARANDTFNVKDNEYPVVARSGAAKNRNEVQAELAQARADGTLAISETAYPALPKTAGTKTRAEVRDELRQYQQAHPNGVQPIYSGA
jgi:hypothetical protein